MKHEASVIGAGLAGSEAAWQLAEKGISVDLYEMKPHKHTPAHTGDGYAELVCSNSLRSDRLENAVGLLKEEMRLLDSLILRCADATRVPAGGALAVDREGFSRMVTEQIEQNPLLRVHHEEVCALPIGDKPVGREFAANDFFLAHMLSILRFVNLPSGVPARKSCG